MSIFGFTCITVHNQAIANIPVMKGILTACKRSQCFQHAVLRETGPKWGSNYSQKIVSVSSLCGPFLSQHVPQIQSQLQKNKELNKSTQNTSWSHDLITLSNTFRCKGEAARPGEDICWLLTHISLILKLCSVLAVVFCFLLSVNILTNNILNKV